MAHELNLDEIIKKYSNKIYTLAFRFTGNYHDAEDIVQETFLSASKNLNSFKGKSNIYTWLYRIAINHCLGRKRRFKRDFFEENYSSIEELENQIPTEVKDWESSPEKHFMVEGLIAEIRMYCYSFMTFKLTDEQRIVYLLKNIMKLSISDISQILNISETTVKARLHRAKNNLVSYFKKQCSYFTDEPSHNCMSRLGFAIQYFPQIMDKVKHRENDEKTQKLISETLKRVDDIDKIYNLIPDEELNKKYLNHLLEQVQ